MLCKTCTRGSVKHPCPNRKTISYLLFLPVPGRMGDAFRTPSTLDHSGWAYRCITGIITTICTYAYGDITTPNERGYSLLTMLKGVFDRLTPDTIGMCTTELGWKVEGS
jgi:hypothetical protein